MKIFLTTLVLSSTLLSGAVFAASGTGTATAEVLPRPITVTINQGLNYGKFQVGSTGSTVSASGVSGDVTMIDGSSLSGLDYTITGEPDTSVTISAVPTTLSEPGGETMTIQSIDGSATLSSSGSYSFVAEPALSVNGSQKAGVYIGTVILNANY